MDFQPDGWLKSIDSKGDDAIKAGSELAREQLRAIKSLRFGLYLIAAFFVIVAAFLAVFAPTGREDITKAIVAVLGILALGCVGYSHFAFSGFGVRASAKKRG